MNNPNTDLESIPLYLDGSDGSMWPVNDNSAHWELCKSDRELAKRRLVRVSDLLEWLGFRETPNPQEVFTAPCTIPDDVVS